MYDYVLQYGFEKEVQKDIQKIKDYLKYNNIEDKERNWLPHITIDLYNCNDQKQFVKVVDKIVDSIELFKIEFKNLNDFNKETLYIEPFNKNKFLELKSIFNEGLKQYMLEHRKNRIYNPHITLCTNYNIDQITYKLAMDKFVPFSADIKYIWIYNQKMELIKQYELKNK